jgi:putative protein kinase ArgK-like GTPase of G3E family
VASEAKGIAELATAIANYEQFLVRENLALTKRVRSWRERLLEMLRDALLRRIVRERLTAEAIDEYARRIAEHKLDPYALIDEIVAGIGADRVER